MGYGMALAGLLGGVINSSQSLPTADIGNLMSTIQNAGQYQQQIINALPDATKKQLAEYAASMGQAGGQYQAGVQGQGQQYLDQIKSLYGPNSQAAQAQMGAAKSQIYSTVPGTQDAIRGALAATGGLGRGNAATALAQPYVNAAQQYGQTASNIVGQQTQQGQQAQQQALTVVNSMNANMFQEMFGMSQAQATQILQTGNNALRQQLSDLLTQSNTQTGQMLSAGGIAANNGYQNAVTRNAQQGDIYSGIANLGLQGIQSGMGYMNSGALTDINGTGSEYGYVPDVNSPGYMNNQPIMAKAMGY